VKLRQNGRIVSVAAIIALGVNNDGRREMLGMDIGPSEAETFWTEFLRQLRRGLLGVKLVVSDAHAGVKAAVSKVLTTLLRPLHARRVVSAFIATAFAQDDAEAAKLQWRKVADQLRPSIPTRQANERGRARRKGRRMVVLGGCCAGPGGDSQWRPVWSPPLHL
jgi:putative transposase